MKKAAATLIGAVGFPYVISSSALGKNGLVAPSNRIVIGAIGLGWQGTSNMNAFLHKDDVQFVAVCDIDANHLQKAKNTVDEVYGNNNCAVYTDFRELIARGGLDAVSIALPDHWHSVPAITAARSGLDIYGEKPLSHTLHEGRAMCDAVKQYGRIWQTGSWQRSVRNFHRACELVRNEKIGKVKYAEVGLGRGHSDYADTREKQAPEPPPKQLDYEFWLGPAPWAEYCPARVHKNWRWVLSHGGGKIMDWVGHHVDIAHWGLGLQYTGPIEVQGWGKFPGTGVWDAPTEYEFTCKYANGATILVASRFPSGVKWYGEEGWVWVDRGNFDAEPKGVLKEKISPDDNHLYRSRDHFRNFLDCVKNRRETIASCEIAHRSASVGHLGQIAIALGRKIRFNPDTEEILDDSTAAKMLGKVMRSPWHL